MNREGLSSRRRLASSLVAALTLLVCGCQSDPSRDQSSPTAVALPRGRLSDDPGAAPLPPMRIGVAEMRADPTVDDQVIRAALRDAETGLVACLDDDGATGVIVLAFPIGPDGAAFDIVEGARTTYGSEAARGCIARIVGTMRFPRRNDTGRAEVEVTLEVSPRR